VGGDEAQGSTEMSWTFDETTGDRLLTEMHIFNFKKGLPAGEYEFVGIWTKPDPTNPGGLATDTVRATVVFE